MRILFVVKEFPHSRVIGGPIIIYNRVKYLSQRHDVSLLAFADGPTREQVSSVAGYCKDLRLVPFPPKRGCLQKAKDLISGPVPPYFMLSLSLIHISEPTRLGMISYAVFCLKKKK